MMSSDCTKCKSCECSGRGCDGGENCCWAKAVAVKKFKTRVLLKYIIEVIFDVVVSVLSVITDIASVIIYFQKGRWGLAVLTAIPVLLPTIVFTNVYLADETQGYCKLPKRGRRVAASRGVSESDDKESTSTATTAKASSTDPLCNETPLDQFHSKMDFHCGTCHMLCVSCCGCWGGMLRSICYKDETVRDNGAKMFKKSIKRLLKYLFGTFVLRYISLAWYAKAFIFGIRAYNEPKKYMKIALPNTHWSYDLLVKLDFLQAALENAPQCIVQLYVLMVYSDENKWLGIVTLCFSFLDFVRVSVSVQWDIHKGPVIAPSGCYKSLSWKFVNMSSWCFLYIGRSAALALVIATANNWTIAVPIVIILFHIILFAKLLSRVEYGVAAQKLLVSVFISIFFLPEFDTSDLPVLTQFYYAVVHIENLFFVVPWNGMDYQYCTPNYFSIGNNKPTPKNLTDGFNSSVFNSSSDSKAVVKSAYDCLIEPKSIVMAVPVLTMLGIVTRLAASKRMSEYKKTIPARSSTLEMEEQIANIYSKKWTSMSFSTLFKAFMNMLKNEVIYSDPDEIKKRKEKDEENSKNPVFIISPSFNKEFQASQRFIRSAMAMASFPELKDEDFYIKTKRSMSVDACTLTYRGKLGQIGGSGKSEEFNTFGNLLGVEVPKRSKSQDDMNYEERRNKINVMENVDIQFIKIESQGQENCPYVMEMTWI